MTDVRGAAAVGHDDGPGAVVLADTDPADVEPDFGAFTPMDVLNVDAATSVKDAVSQVLRDPADVRTMPL